MTQDWRIAEGPAIGTEPEFELSEIAVYADFYVTGGMSRRISATLATATPTRVESLDRLLPDLPGQLWIHDDQPRHSYPGLYDDHFGHIELDGQRGALAVRPSGDFQVHLYLAPDQFAMLLPLLVPAPARAHLQIEIERTIDQGVTAEEKSFWNDALSPVILFNEFTIAAGER